MTEQENTGHGDGAAEGDAMAGREGGAKEPAASGVPPVDGLASLARGALAALRTEALAENLAELGETAREIGDRAALVAARQIDPFFGDPRVPSQEEIDREPGTFSNVLPADAGVLSEEAFRAGVEKIKSESGTPLHLEPRRELAPPGGWPESWPTAQALAERALAERAEIDRLSREARARLVGTLQAAQAVIHGPRTISDEQTLLKEMATTLNDANEEILRMRASSAFAPVRDAFAAVGIEATIREVPTDREVRVHTDARVSTIRLVVDRADVTGGGHDQVHVWNRGAKAGVLVVQAGDGDGITELLAQGMCRDRGRAVNALLAAADAMDLVRAEMGLCVPSPHLAKLVHELGDKAHAARGAASRIEMMIGGPR